MLSHFSHVQRFVTLWTMAHQVPLSMGFSRQKHWNRLPFPSPEDFPNPGIELVSLMSPALAGVFFTTSATWEAQMLNSRAKYCNRLCLFLIQIFFFGGLAFQIILFSGSILIIILPFPFPSQCYCTNYPTKPFFSEISLLKVSVLPSNLGWLLWLCLLHRILLRTPTWLLSLGAESTASWIKCILFCLLPSFAGEYYHITSDEYT